MDICPYTYACSLNRWLGRVVIVLMLPAMAATAQDSVNDQGRVRVSGTAAEVQAALQAPCAIRQWLGHVDAIRVLSHPAANQTLVYTRQNLPWPWHARDAVSRFTVSHHNQTIVIDQVNVDGVVPTEPDVVRIPRLHARWQLTAADHTTIVDYQQQIDLGGHVPQWLSQRGSTQLVAHSLAALQDYMARPSTDRCEVAGG